MNFLLGLALLVLLIPFNMFALKIIDKIKSPSVSHGVLVIMFFGNLMLALAWGLGLKPEVTNITSFLIGIGLASMINMFYKITQLLITKKLK